MTNKLLINHSVMPKTSAKNAVLENPPTKTKLIIAINLINIFSDGPLVSFKGSPTVSPITAALC